MFPNLALLIHTEPTRIPQSVFLTINPTLILLETPKGKSKWKRIKVFRSNFLIYLFWTFLEATNDPFAWSNLGSTRNKVCCWKSKWYYCFCKWHFCSCCHCYHFALGQLLFASRKKNFQLFENNRFVYALLVLQFYFCNTKLVRLLSLLNFVSHSVLLFV